MNTSRKSFLQLIAAAALPWTGFEHVCARLSPRRAEPVQIESWLREWMLRPRFPLLESAHPTTAWLIEAALRGDTVEFCYVGGSEPGRMRRVSPALVFHLDNPRILYMAGYCHGRRQERVFRVDKIQLLSHWQRS